MFFSTKIPEGTTCRICGEDFKGDVVIHEGGEKHPLHWKCFEVWMKTQEEQKQFTPNCPVCRKEVPFGMSLVRSAEEGDLKTLQVLLKHGPFPIDYDVAIFSAAEKGHHEIVKILLQNGSISNVIAGFALQKVATNGHLEVVKLLLYERKMRYELIPHNDLKISLQIAKKKGFQEIVNELQPLCNISSIFE